MFEILETIDIDVKDLEVWNDNPVKRASIPDAELRKSIEENGIRLVPIAVVRKGKSYLVVDGNRRVRIARELEISGCFIANVYSENTDIVKLAITINSTGKNWDEQTYGQLLIGHPERVENLPLRFTGRLSRIYDLLGKDYEQFILNYPVNAYTFGYQLVTSYIKKTDAELLKKAVLWIGRHKLVAQVRRAMKAGVDPSVIERCILEDRPLKDTVVPG